MKFEWDENKRKSNITKHGIDFIECFQVFDGRPLCSYTSKNNHDEKRYVSVCLINNREITTIWTPRKLNTVRIISMRRARNEEKKKYHDLYS